MKKLTPKQIEAQIKRNNAKFKKASAAQKRVLIAKDVLARLESGQFKAETGDWLTMKGYYENSFDIKAPAQKQLIGGEPCTGCALGGLMMACTIFNNRVRNQDVSGIDLGVEIEKGKNIRNGLNRTFSTPQLRLIETAFEMDGGFDWQRGQFKLSEQAQPAIEFGSRFSGARGRLVAIMQNIIANKRNVQAVTP